MMKRVALAFVVGVLIAPIVSGAAFARDRAHDNRAGDRARGKYIEQPAQDEQTFWRQNDRANDNRRGDRARGK
jgi:hypothetical protein